MSEIPYEVVSGDCRDTMALMADNSVDAVVTDPPYGLSFMGKGWDHGVPGVEFWAEALRVLKPGGHLVAFGGSRTYHRLACAIEDAGFEIRDQIQWLYGSGFPKSHNGPWGGTALKPAHEPIVLARKPLTGTVAATVAEYGTGALNIDRCRVGTSKDVPASSSDAPNAVYGTASPRKAGRVGMDPNVGRWPANVVLDEEAGALLDEQTGELTSGANPTRRGSNKFANTYGDFAGQAECVPIRGVDKGGASRFFYCAKASKKEREAGLEGMDAKACNDGRQTPVDNAYQRGDTLRTNTHPTVKPVALMRWLCRLVTPPGGLILDPFTGSGSTGVAAIAEGFRFIGCEREAEYLEIARRRLEHAAGSVAA